MTMDCKSAIEKLYQYLDRELTVEEHREVKQHLDACPPCAQFFRFEEGLLSIVGDICRKQHAPESLRTKVQELQASQTPR